MANKKSFHLIYHTAKSHLNIYGHFTVYSTKSQVSKFIYTASTVQTSLYFVRVPEQFCPCHAKECSVNGVRFYSS